MYFAVEHNFLIKFVQSLVLIWVLTFPVKWTQEKELSLAQAYMRLKDTENKWKRIGEELTDLMGEYYEPEKCRLKIKCMREKYDRQKKHNLAKPHSKVAIEQVFDEAFASETGNEMETVYFPTEGET